MFSNGMFEPAMVGARDRVLGVGPVIGVSAKRKRAVRINPVAGAPRGASHVSTLQAQKLRNPWVNPKLMGRVALPETLSDQPQASHRSV